MSTSRLATAEQIEQWKEHLPSALEKSRDGLPLDQFTDDEIASMAYWHTINNDL